MNNGALFSSTTPEWYTPAAIVDSVIDTLGTIDLDPCSNSHDHPNVPAAVHYTKEDNGLEKPWQGRAFMNPPYGREVATWVNKFIEEIGAGRVTEAVILVAARPDTRWFAKLANTCDRWCAIRGRLHFSDGPTPAPFPSAIFYHGDNPEKFSQAFDEHGTIWMQATQPAKAIA